MPSPKPEWLEHLVDWSQIVSAVATFAAVIVAIWLARRSESQRLLIVPGWRDIATLYNNTPGMDKECYLTVTVVNAGILPVQIDNVSLRLSLKTGPWFGGLANHQVGDEKRLPVSLTHGEKISFQFQVRSGFFPFDSLHPTWYFWKRPSFRVDSSLGASYAKTVSFGTSRQMKRFLQGVPR